MACEIRKEVRHGADPYHVLIANDNGHISGGRDCGGSKGKSNSRETHFKEDQR